MNMLRMISLFLGFLMLMFVLVAPSALAVNRALSFDGDEDCVRFADSDVYGNIPFTLEALLFQKLAKR